MKTTAYRKSGYGCEKAPCANHVASRRDCKDSLTAKCIYCGRKIERADTRTAHWMIVADDAELSRMEALKFPMVEDPSLTGVPVE